MSIDKLDDLISAVHAVVPQNRAYRSQEHHNVVNIAFDVFTRIDTLMSILEARVNTHILHAYDVGPHDPVEEPSDCCYCCVDEAERNFAQMILDLINSPITL